MASVLRHPNTPRIVIVGGGFNGRLLQSIFFQSRVFDWRDQKPEKDARQFGPQYLWTPLPEFTCRSFPVTTLVDNWPATSVSVWRYKHKVEKELDGGDWRAQFRSRMTGYDLVLPPDTVEYGRRIVQIDLDRRRLLMSSGQYAMYDYLISTIPLFSLLGMIKTGAYEGVARLLRFRPIYFSVAPLSRWRQWHPTVWRRGMRVNYVSDPAVPWYRETWRDGQVFRESLIPTPGALKFVPGKIYPSPHATMATRSLHEHGIWTFGRFASWEPDELAHETYQNAWTWAVGQGLRLPRRQPDGETVGTV